MSNVLSQDEIDALLNAFSSGEEMEPSSKSGAGGEVRLYDFRTANKFPKEQIRTLRSIFDNFAQLLANQLTGTLRAVSNVKVLSVEEVSYYDFNNALPSPVLLCIMNIPPLGGSITMAIAPEVAYAMVNRIFGGTMDNTDTEKAFTEIELSVVERVVHQIMPMMDEAWLKIVPVNAMLERMETSPQFAQIVALNEQVALVTLEVRIGDMTGLVSICLPHLAIEPISNQLSSRMWFSASRAKDIVPRTQEIQSKLARSDVEIRAVFGETNAAVRDILCLQLGDVVQLSHMTNQHVLVQVEGVAKFTGVIGVSGSHYAVKVAEMIQGEENNV